jgi:hypothetical protein
MMIFTYGMSALSYGFISFFYPCYIKPNDCKNSTDDEFKMLFPKRENNRNELVMWYMQIVMASVLGLVVERTKIIILSKFKASECFYDWASKSD